MASNGTACTVTTKQIVDNLVFEFFHLALDNILQGRRAVIESIDANQFQYGQFADNSDFCKQLLKNKWRSNITKPVVVDIFIFNPLLKENILIERWKIVFTRDTELKDARQVQFINRRIITLLRSLHCFIRLLPGFNLMNMSQRVPTLNFDIYDGQIRTTRPSATFSHEISTYQFTPVSNSKGYITMALKFITPQALQEVLHILNNGNYARIPVPTLSLPSDGRQREEDTSRRERAESAAILIPVERRERERVSGAGAAYSAGSASGKSGSYGSRPSSFQGTAANSLERDRERDRSSRNNAGTPQQMHCVKDRPNEKQGQGQGQGQGSNDYSQSSPGSGKSATTAAPTVTANRHPFKSSPSHGHRSSTIPKEKEGSSNASHPHSPPIPIPIPSNNAGKPFGKGTPTGSSPKQPVNYISPHNISRPSSYSSSTSFQSSTPPFCTANGPGTPPTPPTSIPLPSSATSSSPSSMAVAAYPHPNPPYAQLFTNLVSTSPHIGSIGDAMVDPTFGARKPRSGSFASSIGSNSPTSGGESMQEINKEFEELKLKIMLPKPPFLSMVNIGGMGGVGNIGGSSIALDLPNGPVTALVSSRRPSVSSHGSSSSDPPAQVNANAEVESVAGSNINTTNNTTTDNNTTAAPSTGNVSTSGEARLLDVVVYRGEQESIRRQSLSEDFVLGSRVPIMTNTLGGNMSRGRTRSDSVDSKVSRPSMGTESSAEGMLWPRVSDASGSGGSGSRGSGGSELDRVSDNVDDDGLLLDDDADELPFAWAGSESQAASGAIITGPGVQGHENTGSTSLVNYLQPTYGTSPGTYQPNPYTTSTTSQYQLSMQQQPLSHPHQQHHQQQQQQHLQQQLASIFSAAEQSTLSSRTYSTPRGMLDDLNNRIDRFKAYGATFRSEVT